MSKVSQEEFNESAEPKVKEESKPKFKLKPGVNKCSNAEYHSDHSFFSSSAFKTLLKDPPAFKAIYLDQTVEYSLKDTGALSLGSLVHSMILEPELVEEEYVLSEATQRRGWKYEESKREAELSGKTVITTKQKELADKLIVLYENRKAAVDLIAKGEPEVSLCLDLNGIPTKVRADWLNLEEGYLVDVKTTSDDTDVHSFRRTCEKYDYLLSAALYTWAFEEFYGKPLDFYFIVLGKFSKTCDVYRISKKSMEEGKARIQKAFDEFKYREENDAWNDYLVEEI